MCRCIGYSSVFLNNEQRFKLLTPGLSAFVISAGLVFCETKILGAVSIRKTVLPGMAIPMLKIRRPNGRLIFNMEIAIRR